MAAETVTMEDFQAPASVDDDEVPHTKLDSSHNTDRSRFRFKATNSSKRTRSPSPSTSTPSHSKRAKTHRRDSTTPSCHSHHDHSHHHHHRRRHQHKSQRTSPPKPSHSPDTHRRSPSLPPDVAFRESLFDALADDEGAAYWEGVYGQPIHIYSSSKPGPLGQLEQMSEEEYAAFVREKMWVRTHQCIMEERQRREEGRRKQKERVRERDHERERWDAEVEASLRRGTKRREERGWSEIWRRYSEGWEDLEKGHGNERDIRWPTRSGRFQDGDEAEVEKFFGETTRLHSEMSTVLKRERVRWHPDKMGQRLGRVEDGKETQREHLIRNVTAVFQVVDRLWNTSSGSTDRKS